MNTTNERRKKKTKLLFKTFEIKEFYILKRDNNNKFHF